MDIIAIAESNGRHVRKFFRIGFSATNYQFVRFQGA
jgi:hypothetical protein